MTGFGSIPRVSRIGVSPADEAGCGSSTRRRPLRDNRILTRLLGEYDSHLALIEDRLGIDAHAHGNVVILSGPAAALAIAREVLGKALCAHSEG